SGPGPERAMENWIIGQGALSGARFLPLLAGNPVAVELGAPMLSLRFRRSTLAAVAVAALLLPGVTQAQASETAASFPTPEDLKAMTTAGSYLAARHASLQRDAAAAASFYNSALRGDPKNNELLDRAFIS